MLARIAILWLSLAVCVGCLPNAGPSATADATPAAAAPASTPPQDSRPAKPTPPATPATAIGLAPLQPETGHAAAGSETPATAAPVVGAPGSGLPRTAAPSVEPPAEGTGRVVATAGVGKQGQSLKEHTGVLVEPLKVLLNFRQKAVFEMQIPSAMKSFEATEGRKPQSHDEFMDKIITPNQIKLPELPAGSKYVYDPQRGELMVEQPAR